MSIVFLSVLLSETGGVDPVIDLTALKARCVITVTGRAEHDPGDADDPSGGLADWATSVRAV